MSANANNISRDSERDLITAVGRPMVMMLIANLRAGNNQRLTGPVVNNTQPLYAANLDYDEAIDGVIVQHLTVAAVQLLFDTTLALLPKYVNALREEGIVHPHDLAQFTST